jgi:hypothetical protein
MIMVKVLQYTRPKWHEKPDAKNIPNPTIGPINQARAQPKQEKKAQLGLILA